MDIIWKYRMIYGKSGYTDIQSTAKVTTIFLNFIATTRFFASQQFIETQGDCLHFEDITYQQKERVNS